MRLNIKQPLDITTIGGNNIGNSRCNNNINMDNKISKNIYENRRRNFIWFNPPFCNLFNINIGKYFLGLINKHFKDDKTPLEKWLIRIM